MRPPPSLHSPPEGYPRPPCSARPRPRRLRRVGGLCPHVVLAVPAVLPARARASPSLPSLPPCPVVPPWAPAFSAFTAPLRVARSAPPAPHTTTDIPGHHLSWCCLHPTWSDGSVGHDLDLAGSKPSTCELRPPALPFCVAPSPLRVHVLCKPPPPPPSSAASTSYMSRRCPLPLYPLPPRLPSQPFPSMLKILSPPRLLPSETSLWYCRQHAEVAELCPIQVRWQFFSSIFNCAALHCLFLQLCLRLRNIFLCYDMANVRSSHCTCLLYPSF